MSLEKSDLLLKLKLYKAEDLAEQYLVDALIASMSENGYIKSVSIDAIYSGLVTCSFTVTMRKLDK
jgi:hypothetical protein